MPAVTVNKFGKGKAYYLATDFENDGYIKFYSELLKDVISSDEFTQTPVNVSVTRRYDGENEYVFVMNFNNETKQVDLPFDYEIVSGTFENGNLKPYGIAVLRKFSL